MPREALIISERSTNSAPNLPSRQALTACSPRRSCSSGLASQLACRCAALTGQEMLEAAQCTAGRCSSGLPLGTARHCPDAGDVNKRARHGHQDLPHWARQDTHPALGGRKQDSGDRLPVALQPLRQGGQSAQARASSGWIRPSCTAYLLAGHDGTGA